MPRLHLDRLECQITVRDLRAALKSLPTRVDETYDDAMTRIQNQVPEYSQLAMSALSWISNALRPLKWYELQHALAICRGDQKLDEEALVDESLLISVSAGLIILDAQSKTIRLAHFTVEEYFEGRKQSQFPNADVQIAEICLTYLSFDVFETGPCPSPKEMQTRLKQNCFLKYASVNWSHHALRADEHIDQDLVVRFLTNKQMVSCCNQAKLNAAFNSGVLSRRSQEPRVRKVQSSELHFAARLGLLSTLKRLLERQYGVDSKDYMGQTPLTLAVIEDHVEMVKFLVDQDNALAKSRDDSGRTPLSYAALHGHTEIVKLLIARGDVIADSKDKYNHTPLLYAALYGYTEIVKLLIARGDVIADSQGNNGRTPLSYAASQGHTEVVKLLVARNDIVVDPPDRTVHTPLSHAALQGHEEVVKLLTARSDVRVDSRDSYGRTPLSYAAKEGHTDVVKLLIVRDDVSAESQDDSGRTPLSYAADSGWEVVVKLLLERLDVAADSQDKDSRTPLSFAAEIGREAIVKLLLDRNDVVVDSRNKNGRTPLSYAAGSGRKAIVKLLLDQPNTAADSRDGYGRTPLSYAAAYGY